MLNQQLSPGAIQTEHILIDGVHVHESRIPMGRKIITKHRPVDRIYVLAQGSVILDNAGVKTQYDAPAYIKLAADQGCEISTVSDTTLYGMESTPAENIEQVINKDVEIEHYFAGGIYAKQMRIGKNCKIPTHRHVYDHLSVLAQGRVRVTVSKITQEYTAPAAIEIKRDLVHTIEALEDTVWYCIHATEETDPDSANNTIIVGRNNVI
jgi:quercetin dioxygenase-like cupin family protein